MPTPRFWVVADDLESVAAEAEFPLIVKPLLSHVFEAKPAANFSWFTIVRRLRKPSPPSAHRHREPGRRNDSRTRQSIV